MRILRYAAFLLAICLPTIAHADPVTYTLSFTATGDTTASGSYTLTFDPTTTLFNTAVGLTVNSFSDGFTGPSITEFDYSAGYLIIGGSMTGVSGVTAGTNDYYVYFSGDMSDLTFFSAYFGSTTLNQNDFDQVGSVTVTTAQVPSPTPEPSSLLLLGTGFLGVLGVARRKFFAR